MQEQLGVMSRSPTSGNLAGALRLASVRNDKLRAREAVLWKCGAAQVFLCCKLHRLIEITLTKSELSYEMILD